MMVRFANEEDMEQLMSIRLECLRAVNGLDEDYAFSPALLQSSRDFFRAPDQLTVLAMDGDKAVACATLCFLHLMPTFSHPTGHRGHLMNVYTRPDWRRQGIARRMIDMLLRRAREEGMTEISLDATEEGRKLYATLGFQASDEAMTIRL